MHPRLAQSKFIENRNDAWLQLLGRIKDGVSAAEAGMDLLAQQIKEANTPAGTITKGLPFSEQHIKFEPGGRHFNSTKEILFAAQVIDGPLCWNFAGMRLKFIEFSSVK
jgi:hypothetical protein